MSGSKWNLSALMASLPDRVSQELRSAREAIGHPGAKGDGSEKVWQKLFKTYLPARYAVDKASILDSTGAFSDEIDVVLYDRQYSFLIFEFESIKVIPAEAVYAVFESKQEINAGYVEYAQKKTATVRRFHRTSAEVMTIDGLRTAIPQPVLSWISGVREWLEICFRQRVPCAGTRQRSRRRTSRYRVHCGLRDFWLRGVGLSDGRRARQGRDLLPAGADYEAAEDGAAPAIDMGAYAKWLMSDIATCEE